MKIQPGYDSEIQTEALHRLHEMIGGEEDFFRFVGSTPLMELNIGTAFTRGLIQREMAEFEADLDRSGLLVKPQEQ